MHSDSYCPHCGYDTGHSVSCAIYNATTVMEAERFVAGNPTQGDIDFMRKARILGENGVQENG